MRNVESRFHAVVNMNAPQLRAWLKTAESKAVGFRRAGKESVGRQSARKIIRILEGALDDPRHMTKVVGYVARHLAQRPQGDIRHTRWRYSLMNWGHDPLGLGHL